MQVFVMFFVTLKHTKWKKKYPQTYAKYKKFVKITYKWKIKAKCNLNVTVR